MEHVTQAEPEVPPASGDPVLTPQISGNWALRLAHLPAIAALVMLFLVASYLPLRPTDLWGHVAWGGWILDHHRLPTEDPTFPLAQGMRVIDSAWLSQVIFAAIDRLGGPEWLSNVFALTTLATWLVIWRALYLRSGNWLTSFLMMAIVFGVAFSRLTTIRPEIFAWLCFAILWWLLAPQDSASDRRQAPSFEARLWIGVPIVMILWANLHGSFVCGLAVLASYAIGTALSTWWQSRSVAETLGKPAVQHSMLLFELAFVSTLVNPYGIDLLISAVTFARNSNLKDVLEWQPLAFGAIASYEFIAAAVLAMGLLRLSRHPISTSHLIALTLMAAATLAGNRMIGWFALTFGITFMPLLHERLNRLAIVQAVNTPWNPEVEVGRGFPLLERSWSYSLIGLLLLWIAFALSPVSAPVLGNKPRAAAQLYGPDTPIGLTDYLQKHPIDSLAFCPQWWGDWIHRAAPDVQPFMTSNIHLAPRIVWADYVRVSNLHAGWANTLGRYRAEHVILDKKTQVDLNRALRRDTAWRLLYEDERAALFALRKPNGTNPLPPATTSAK